MVNNKETAEERQTERLEKGKTGYKLNRRTIYIEVPRNNNEMKSREMHRQI
jgi:hypothetical protein